jgi:DNA-binding NarL/FixJ family response regulator
MVQQIRPDLVLLDLRLPGMDGFQVLEAMRGDTSLSEMPVVILSNYGDPSMMRRAQSLGVSDYLVKSRVTPEQISRRIRAWISGETLN